MVEEKERKSVNDRSVAILQRGTRAKTSACGIGSISAFRYTSPSLFYAQVFIQIIRVLINSKLEGASAVSVRVRHR